MSDDELAVQIDAFDAGLKDILGARYVGLFSYGAAMFPPSPVSDFDAHVVVTEPFDGDTRAQIRAFHDRLGWDLDVWYVTRDAIDGVDPPVTVYRTDGMADESWAIHRAHILAGRYVYRGFDPRDVISEPTWEQLDASLQGELAFIAQCDSRPYCVLNLCRVLYSYETRDVVIGKYQSAVWAFGYLPAEEHQLIRDSLDAYRTKNYVVDGDVAGFSERMLTRIARAREFA